MNDRHELFERPAALGALRLFFRWECRKAVGKVAERISIWTLLRQLRTIQRIQRKALDHRYTLKEDDEMREDIIVDLPRLDKASTLMRTKPILDQKDVEDLIYFLICVDEYEWQHSRELFEAVHFIVTLKNHGLRPGEGIESSSYRGQNEGLHYRDLEFSIARHLGKKIICSTTRLRFRKGRRDAKAAG